MSHLLEDHPDWPKNAMNTPTPRTDAAIIRDKMILSEVGPLEIVDAGTSRQLERDLAAAQDNRQYTCEAHRDEVKKGGRCVWCDLNVAHEELNTQAHELERLLNELSAAQERVEDLEVRCANAEARAENWHKVADSRSAELIKQMARAEASEKLLAECLTTLDHARVFIETREKMHEIGREMYDQLRSQIRAAIAEGEK